MTLDSFVKKIKKAVTGIEEPVSESQPFHWEPAPMRPLEEDAPDWAIKTDPGIALVEPAAAVPVHAPQPGLVAVPAPVAQAVPEPAAPTAPAPSPRRAPAEPKTVVGAGVAADVADFAVVYHGADVEAPSHGYGVDRVAEMLDHPSLRGLDKAVKASAVLAALDAAGVHLHDVVHDGLLRHKALVAFEAAKELEFQAVRPRNQHRAEQMRLAIATFQQRKSAELEALTREATAAITALNRLKARQRAEEERFHRAVSLFVEPLPARVIPMGSKAESAAGETPEPRAVVAAEEKSELKLVFATPPFASPGERPIEPSAPEAPPPTDAVGQPQPDDTMLKLTPDQILEVVQAASDAQAAPGSEQQQIPFEAARSEGVVVRLTDEQALEVVSAQEAPQAQLVSRAQAGSEEAAARAADDASVIRLTVEQQQAIVEFVEASTQEPSAPASAPADAAEPSSRKGRTIRLTAEQTAAILASFGGAEAGAAPQHEAANADGQGGGEPPAPKPSDEEGRA